MSCNMLLNKIIKFKHYIQLFFIMKQTVFIASKVIAIMISTCDSLRMLSMLLIVLRHAEYLVEKQYHISPYFGSFEAFLMSKWPRGFKNCSHKLKLLLKYIGQIALYWIWCKQILFVKNLPHCITNICYASSFLLISPHLLICKKTKCGS